MNVLMALSVLKKDTSLTVDQSLLFLVSINLKTAMDSKLFDMEWLE
jgi:hypothetical protein